MNSGVIFLEKLDLDELREEWRRHYGAPPLLRSSDLLRLMLAWRLQAAQEGGLGREVLRLLRQSASKQTASLPASGTLIRKEWQGIIHDVLTLPDGSFLYQDERFTSLSKVALKITGTRWNGPRFFGLRGDG